MALSRNRSAEVQFAYMPYSKLTHPALGPSILKTCLSNNGIACDISYNTYDFADLIGVENYTKLLNTLTPGLLGEWTFARSAFGSGFIESKFHDHGCSLEGSEDYEKISHIATEWIENLADTISREPPRILICSSMFQQNVASLAILRAVKERCPSVFTVMGGPNTEGILGIGLLRRAPWLDFICGGEGEETLPELCQLLLDNKTNAELPMGVVPQSNVHQFEGLYQVNIPRPSLGDMAKSPAPSFDDFFEKIKQLRFKVKPGLLLESSRGCWWGQRSQCTFCGLNGEGISYRAQPPEKMVETVKEMTSKYDVKNIEFVDNIIAKNYFDEFLPRLAGMNLSMFYETKADFTEKDAQRFHQSGVRFIQPGIESLSDPVLRLMRKGTSAALNIECLRLCREYGLLPAWTILTGFPGESQSWYEETALVMPKLFHLRPPNALISIRFDRFSPYHDHPDQWSLDLVPYDSYKHVYPDYQGQYDDIAYFFKRRGVSDAHSSPYTEGHNYEKCKSIIRQWKHLWSTRSSSHQEQPQLCLYSSDEFKIYDDRSLIHEPICSKVSNSMVQLIRFCRTRRTISSIRSLTTKYPTLFSSAVELNTLLEQALENSWIICLSNNYISVVQEHNHQHLDLKDWPGGLVETTCPPSSTRLLKQNDSMAFQ